MSTPSDGTPATERQVLVVGGGVEGLATATFLAREGLSPVVVTADDAGRDDAFEERVAGQPQTAILWSTTVALLAEFGVADALRGASEPIRQWRLHHASDGTTERLTGADDGDHPAVAVDRDQLRRRLRAPLSSQQLRLSKTPQRLAPTDHGLRVDFADGVRERFDAVVGADGARSWVRGVGPGRPTPTPWGTTEWSLSAEGLGAAGTVVDVWGPAAALTCHPNGRGRFVAPTTDEDDGRRSHEAATARLGALLNRADAAEVGVEATDVTLGPGRRHCGLLADQWSMGRVAFVGAAARSLPPTLPLEPSLAVEAAAVLAAELTRSPSVDEALRRYARHRRGRLRTLDRRLSIRTPSPGDGSESDPFRRAHSLRTAVLRSFFAGPESPVSSDVVDFR